jgi:putative RecB family exonuclease
MSERKARYLHTDGNLKVSASSIETFKQCPRKWMYIYVEDARSVSTFATILGTFAHSVLEEFYQWDPEERTVELAKEIARYEWDKMTKLSKAFKSLRLSEEEQKRMRVQAWKSVRGAWELEVPSEVSVLEVEKEFMMEHEGAWVRGFIDRVERDGDGIRITDYKTGNAPKEAYKRDKLVQVELYALAAQELYEEPVVSAALMYLGKEIVQTEINEVVLRRTRKRLSKAIDAMTTSLSTGVYEPKVGPLCAWCDFLIDCPEGQEEVFRLNRYGRVRKDSPGAQLLGL